MITFTVSASSVHPRVRGEQTLVSSALIMGDGSSPRARGAELELAAIIDQHWFIPACAGSRWCRVRSRSLASVHPRVRGEQT